MNLFTSSVVMSICALSDTMSDIAQEAKRGMSRTLHLLKKLSTRASLPMQCSTILEDLVGLILKREKAAMLFGLEEGLGSTLREEKSQAQTIFDLQRSMCLIFILSSPSASFLLASVVHHPHQKMKENPQKLADEFLPP
jgi:hypothetical protein